MEANAEYNMMPGHVPEMTFSVYVETFHDDGEASDHRLDHAELESGLRRYKEGERRGKDSEHK